jgi:hypothetical protein
MLDLNDLSQIALADRRGLLARAANRQERWQQAPAWGRQQGTQLPAPPAHGVIWLLLPHTLQGIGMAVQSLHSSHTAPVLMLWQPDLASLPVEGLWFDPFHVASASSLPADRLITTPKAVDPEAHPADIFLTLLAMVDQWLDRDLTDTLLPLEEEAARQLSACAPAVPVASNPAKGLAHAFNERVPIFWSADPLAGIPWDWWQRYTLYAEAKAEWIDVESLRHIAVMTRFPRYWPQAGIFVRLAQVADSAEGWLADLERLFRSRRIQSLTIEAPGRSVAAQMLYLFELGEWVALYAAALLGVEPTDRVALDFLYGAN